MALPANWWLPGRGPTLSGALPESPYITSFLVRDPLRQIEGVGKEGDLRGLYSSRGRMVVVESIRTIEVD
jgi:hypothetical protein